MLAIAFTPPPAACAPANAVATSARGDPFQPPKSLASSPQTPLIHPSTDRRKSFYFEIASFGAPRFGVLNIASRQLAT